MTAHDKLRIGIIGAGPAGLLLARILQLRGISATIFEAEESRQVRPQGGTLDLHVNLGQKALKEADLFTEFQKYARYDGEDVKMLDKTGKVFFEMVGQPAGEDHSHPEIDRTLLRSMLLDSVRPDSIKWNRRIASVQSRSDGRWDILFQHKISAGEDDLEGPFDLVVGADGAWSRIRPLLTDVKPMYSSVSTLDTSITDVDARYPEIAKFVGRGSMFASSDGKFLLSQRLGDGSVKIYISLRRPEDWTKTCGIQFEDPQKTREAYLDLFQDWSEDLKHIIRHCDDKMWARPTYAIPVGHKWESKKGLTMIGDAAHLMTPFAGVGVNLAMADAMDLARAVVEGKDDWPAAVSRFEKVMCERAWPEAQKTEDNIEAFFGDDVEKGMMIVGRQMGQK